MFNRLISDAKVRIDLIVIIVLSACVFFIAGTFDILEQVVEFTRAYEDYELDEFIIVAVFLAFAMTVFALRRWRNEIQISKDLERNNEELQDALDEIKKLESILPICASCKDIRDDKGGWHQLETYFTQKSETRFTHTICPKCEKKLYPELDL